MGNNKKEYYVRVILVIGLFLYAILSVVEADIIACVADFVAMVLPVLLDIAIWALRYLLLFSLVYLVFGQIAQHYLARVGVIMVAIVVFEIADYLNLFGGIAVNPFDAVSTAEYFNYKIQSVLMYYFAALLIMPRALWGLAGIILLVVFLLLSSIVGLIPVVGPYLATAISVFSTVAVFAISVLNTLASGVLLVERRLDQLKARRLVDVQKEEQLEGA